MSFPSLMVGILENAQEKPTYLILVFANLIVKYVTFTHEISHVPNKVKEEKKKKKPQVLGLNLLVSSSLMFFSFFHWNRRETIYPYSPSA